jgi:hypothetical protein
LFVDGVVEIGDVYLYSGRGEVYLRGDLEVTGALWFWSVGGAGLALSRWQGESGNTT